MTSPPGGGTVTRPKRASKGPARRKDARISRASSGSRSVLDTPRGSTRTSFDPTHSASAPRSARSSTMVSTSRMRGTFESRTSSEARTHAARIGSAPFLFPEARTVPDSGRPPSMTKDCIARAMVLAVLTRLPFASRSEVLDLELRHVVSWFEAENLSIERELCLERADDVLGLAEAVPLALEEEIRVRDAAFPQGTNDELGLRRRHHLVVGALENEHRRRDPVDEMDRAALAVRLDRLGVRADERVLVLQLELVRLSPAELLEVGDAEVRRTRGEHVREGNGADSRVAAGAATRDQQTIRVGFASVDEVARRIHTVLEIDDAPLAVEALPVRASVAGRASVVHVDDGEAAARPELHVDAEHRSRVPGRAAMAHDDQRWSFTVRSLVVWIRRCVDERVRSQAGLGGKLDGPWHGEVPGAHGELRARPKNLLGARRDV